VFGCRGACYLGAKSEKETGNALQQGSRGEGEGEGEMWVIVSGSGLGGVCSLPGASIGCAPAHASRHFDRHVLERG
jgi:hypothetical protein